MERLAPEANAASADLGYDAVMQLTASRRSIEAELLKPPFVELADRLGALGIVSVVVHGRARGGTSVCYFLRTDGEMRDLVYKAPVDGEEFGDEYELLSLAANGRGLAMRLPRPLALLSDGGYVMERLSGIPLRSSLRLAEGAERQRLAADVLASVRSFHSALGRPYGDLHSRNVLVQADGQLAFIDPGHSADLNAAIAEWPQATPLAADVGLWLYNTCLDGSVAILKNPRQWWYVARFAVTLVATAAASESDPGAFAVSVFEVSGRHARRLRRSPWPAQRARAVFVSASLPLLRRQALRRVRSAIAAKMRCEP